MNLVYYAHSYRKPDAPVVEFFSQLIQSEGLTVSLDPPSDRLNSAKPERHLRSTDGMVAVLTARNGGVSEYILYEISLCLRAQKPLLVFLEDTLPNGLIPSRLLQRRFSRRALLRQVRNHRHAVQGFRSYIGGDPPATYQPSPDMRKCLLSGFEDLPSVVSENVQSQLVDRGYLPEILKDNVLDCLYDPSLQDRVNTAELAIAFVDSGEHAAEYFLGIVRASFVPAILLTANPSFRYRDRIPREYQARAVTLGNQDELHSIIADELTISEEEYVDFENQGQVGKYTQLLIAQGSRTGQYTAGTRNLFVQELHMGDQNINYGQAGAVGRNSTGVINNAEGQWEKLKPTTDINALAAELAQLRSSLRQKAQTVEEDKSVVAISEAEVEAKAGNGPGTLQKLATAGIWALGVAKEIGVKVATEAIEKAAGLG